MLSDARVHGTRASLCFCTCKQEREKPRTKKHSKNRTQRSVSVHTHATHVRTHHTNGKQTETSAQDERGACCAGHVPDLLAWQKRPAHLAYLAKETYFYAHEGHHTARTRTHVRAWTHTPHVHYTTQPGLGSLREIASSLRGCLYNLASSECHFAYTCSHTHTHTFYKHARNKHQQKRTRREILAHLVHLLVHLCQRVPPARTRLSERHSLSKTLSLSRARCRHSSACRGIQKY